MNFNRIISMCLLLTINFQMLAMGGGLRCIVPGLRSAVVRTARPVRDLAVRRAMSTQRASASTSGARGSFTNSGKALSLRLQEKTGKVFVYTLTGGFIFLGGLPLLNGAINITGMYDNFDDSSPKEILEIEKEYSAYKESLEKLKIEKMSMDDICDLFCELDKLELKEKLDKLIILIDEVKKRSKIDPRIPISKVFKKILDDMSVKDIANLHKKLLEESKDLEISLLLQEISNKHKCDAIDKCDFKELKRLITQNTIDYATLLIESVVSESDPEDSFEGLTVEEKKELEKLMADILLELKKRVA